MSESYLLENSMVSIILNMIHFINVTFYRGKKCLSLLWSCQGRGKRESKTDRFSGKETGAARHLPKKPQASPA